jgi:hypothetical protein
MRVSSRIADPGSVKRQALKKIDPVVRRKMEDVGYEMTRLANKKMASRFDLGRPARRRRHEGSRRAKGALDYRVTGSELPITVQYRVLGGDDVVARIIFLNWGTSPHFIPANGNAGGNGTHLAWEDGDGWVVIRGGTPHPGSRKGVGFLEEAMAEAIQSKLR